eukprot:TRINITY_DN5091_c0_g1_i1.p1 TRINITY_DN5091_c0_g1~~TRINITY_DN5091_c0_g1_i1.p1  ORF type:complete len:381 (+),score=54.98 TRINITY_DN5091_c0_g1_i1:57-1199(+)
MSTFEALPDHVQQEIISFLPLDKNELVLISKRWRNHLSSRIFIKLLKPDQMKRRDISRLAKVLSNTVRRIQLVSNMKVFMELFQSFPRLMEAQSTFTWMVKSTLEEVPSTYFPSIRKFAITVDQFDMNMTSNSILDHFPNLKELSLTGVNPTTLLAHPIVSQLETLGIYDFSREVEDDIHITELKSLKHLMLDITGKELVQNILKRTNQLTVLEIDCSDSRLQDTACDWMSNMTHVRSLTVYPSFDSLSQATSSLIACNMKYLQKLDIDLQNNLSTILDQCKYISELVLSCPYPPPFNMFKKCYYLQTLCIWKDFARYEATTMEDIISLCQSCQYLNELFLQQLADNVNEELKLQTEMERILPRKINSKFYLFSNDLEER